ncbi:hypothetical protein ACQEVC_10505 [Plantactinospora sp. CA-294935]|uniref:hypothetical protein n=1 Tax=Plantactinospora sp. CA-294935 TaxID=3240012 RepID=UPI003D8F2DB0
MSDTPTSRAATGAGIRPGAVAVLTLPRGGYGAVQVVSVGEETLLAYALDWYSAQRPTLAQLAGAGPLRLRHHSHDGGVAAINVRRDGPVPLDFDWLGDLPLRPGAPETSASYAGWSYLPDQVYRQREWDLRLPERVKTEYRAARTRGQVEVDLGGEPATLGAATWRLDLAGSALLPATGDVRWAGLDALPRCTTLTWRGPARGLPEALAARPIVSSLTWHDPPAEVDLAASSLTDLTLHGSGVRTLRLPPTLLRCRLAGSVPATVDAAEWGRWISLSVEVTDTPVPLPAGLHGVRRLGLRGDGVISAASLGELAELETLLLSWQKAPGLLVDADPLATLPRLYAVELLDGYGCAADTLPELPALRHLEVDGLRRSVVAPLRSRYRGSRVELLLRGAKSDAWLEANFGNPFRDWVDDDPRGGTAACRAYATALRAVDRLPADGAGRVEAAEPILRALVDALNRIEQRYEIIDTVNREQAGDVFLALADRAGVPADLADTWFDDWRDF